MPPKFVHGLKACCMAVALVLSAAHGAEPKGASSPIGLTRDQVLARYGEPKSQMMAGPRLIMNFTGERLILRDGVVVEVQPITEAAPKKGAPGTTTPPTTEVATTPAPPPVVAPPPPVGVASMPTASAIESLDPAAATPPPAATTPSGPPPKVEIRSVRPPGSPPLPPSQQPAPKSTASTTRPSQAATPVATAPAPTSTPAVAPPVADAQVVNRAPLPATLPPANTTPKVEPVTLPPFEPGMEEKAAREAKAAAAEKELEEKKNRAARSRRRADAGDPNQPGISEAFLTPRTIVIGLLVIGGGIGYLVWRNRQRQLLLAATAVSHVPFSMAAPETTVIGTVFTPELLAKLEWKRFEELVADYYAKTGVVAVRTKSGPSSPVHIKISWKGEPRPFACVQCIAHPEGLVDATRLQELTAVLAAEDIRRGYVVSSGKFSVPARDFAEEKQLTLLPGEIFLEKLNALPESARTEIIQSITNGDYQTPSCPKCDAKMAKSPEDPGMWRCPTHPDQMIKVWKQS